MSLVYVLSAPITIPLSLPGNVGSYVSVIVLAMVMPFYICTYSQIAAQRSVVRSWGVMPPSGQLWTKTGRLAAGH